MQFGTYWVVETTTPAGHATVPDQPVNVTAANPTITLNLSDPRLHKVITLVCHEGSNTLFAVDVANGTSTLKSIGSVPAALSAKNVTQADLCGIGGAAFGGLGHNNKTLVVELGDGH